MTQPDGQFNLADVGFGVSQSLPIIFQCMSGDQAEPLLLQQPEVHLHPRARAALGTFSANVVRESGRTLVVETQSDYLIDRVRREVALGRLRPDDVSHLHFDRQRTQTDIVPLSLDAEGNVLGAPSGYRAFFLEELRKILNRTDA